MKFQLFEVVPQSPETLFISFPIKSTPTFGHIPVTRDIKGGAESWSEFGLFSKLKANPEKRHQALL